MYIKYPSLNSCKSCNLFNIVPIIAIHNLLWAELSLIHRTYEYMHEYSLICICKTQTQMLLPKHHTELVNLLVVLLDQQSNDQRTLQSPSHFQTIQSFVGSSWCNENSIQTSNIYKHSLKKSRPISFLPVFGIITQVVYQNITTLLIFAI